jgi:DNA-binding response OmpR family regulator
MDGYLSKPLTLDALRAALKRWARRSGGRPEGDALEKGPPPCQWMSS